MGSLDEEEMELSESSSCRQRVRQRQQTGGEEKTADRGCREDNRQGMQ